MPDGEDLFTTVRERLDAEARAALAAADNDGNLAWHVTHPVFGGRYTVRTASSRPVLRADMRDSEAGEGNGYDPRATFDPSATAEHASRWDPARALAHVRATRRILEEHESYGGDGERCSTCRDPHDDLAAGAPWPCPTVRLLAQPVEVHTGGSCSGYVATLYAYTQTGQMGKPFNDSISSYVWRK